MTRYVRSSKLTQYVRKRRGDGSGFVSRSAYKLVQLAEKYPLLRPGRAVVDLGAAPGGWCQAVLQTCASTRLYALDLLPLQASLPSVQFMQGDFTEESTRHALRALVAEQGQDSHVDVVLSDMMGRSVRTDQANTSGNVIRDSQASLDLCEAAFDFCQAMLRPTPDATVRPSKSTPTQDLPSVFVCKYFMSAEADEFRREVLAKHFKAVRSEKMDASRTGSREQYWVCLGYRH